MKITMASRLKDAIVLLIYASIDLSPLVSIMDYKFEEIFSHDRIKKYLKDGYSTQLRLNGDELEIFVYNIDGNSEVIKIHELNDVHDFVEHSFKNFRRSKLETETEAYDNDPAGDPGYIRWDDSASDITISGSVYSDEGTTVSGVCDGTTQVVTLKVQGAGSYTSACDAGTGAYSIDNVFFNPGDVLTVFLNTGGGVSVFNVKA
jgi:hypothetical protein